MEKHETTTSEVTENKNKEMSGQESYDLIKTMIRKTQNSGGAHCGDTFLVFGYLSLFLGFFIYYTVSTTGNANWTLAWKFSSAFRSVAGSNAVIPARRRLTPAKQSEKCG